jgi:hypothetical protein
LVEVLANRQDMAAFVLDELTSQSSSPANYLWRTRSKVMSSESLSSQHRLSLQKTACYLQDFPVSFFIVSNVSVQASPDSYHSGVSAQKIIHRALRHWNLTIFLTQCTIFSVLSCAVDDKYRPGTLSLTSDFKTTLISSSVEIHSRCH